jgi:hypothetical protein
VSSAIAHEDFVALHNADHRLSLQGMQQPKQRGTGGGNFAVPCERGVGEGPPQQLPKKDAGQRMQE